MMDYPVLHYEFLEDPATPITKLDADPKEKIMIMEQTLTPKKSYGSCSPISTQSTDEGDSSTEEETELSYMWCFNVFSEDALNQFRRLGKKHAHEKRDVLLCWKLCELIDLEEVASEALIVTVFRNIRLLHLCKYDFMDIVLTMAFCAFYTSEAIAVQGANDYLRKDCAALNISVYFYLAAAHLLDHCAPLKCWTKHVFVDRVSTDCLAKRLMHLFRCQKFKLQVDFEQSVATFYEELTMAVDAFDKQPELTELDEVELPRVSLLCSKPFAPVFPT